MELYGHQKEAIEFAIHNKGCCAIFHDPGLGKTLTGLEIYRHFKAQEPELKLLVVCPLSLINSAWGEDIERFTDLSYSLFKKLKEGEPIPDIVIINYEALISKKNASSIGTLIRKHKFMCILDESSRLKSNKSITTNVLLHIARYFNYRIIASGSPMPNSELELWGQISFVEPRILPGSFYVFRKDYFHLQRGREILKDNNRYMNKWELSELLRSGWKYNITQRNREKLMDEIGRCAHWVKKEDALDLPDKIDETREVKLSAQERQAYDDMEETLIAEIGDVKIGVQIALSKLMKLRQITAGFIYSEDHDPILIGKSSKLKELECLLEELGKQQIIIWVQFHHEVHEIESLIKKRFGSVVTLYSGTKDHDKSIKQFKENKVQYLIAHPRSAAHGLTFTNCSTMVFFSLDYSYESHMQARERIHRIGQKSSCLYMYLIATNSIDKDLLQVLRRKKSLQDMVYGIVRKNWEE